MTLDNEELRSTLRSNGDVELSLDAVSVASRVLYPTENNIVGDRAFDHGAAAIRKRPLEYGTLDPRPLARLTDFGRSWDLGGYVVFYMLKKIGPDRTAKVKRRIAERLTLTFAISVSVRLRCSSLLIP